MSPAAAMFAAMFPAAIRSENCPLRYSSISGSRKNARHNRGEENPGEENPGEENPGEENPGRTEMVSRVVTPVGRAGSWCQRTAASTS
jgi:hypothetical protein